MNDPIPPDPYKALGLDKTATAAAIKTAYRKAALKYHPDKTSDESKIEQFHAIQQAYDVLGDDEKRKHYDNTVRMFDLRRELHKDRPPFPPAARSGSGARTTSYSYETREPSGAQTTGWSSRGPSVFEERRPKDMPEPSPAYKDTGRDSYFDRPAEFSSARKHDAPYEPSPRKQASPPKADNNVRATKTERTRSEAKKQRERQTDRERRSKYAPPGDSYSSDDDSGPTRSRRATSSARVPPSPEPRRARDPRQSDSESFENDRVRKYKNQAEELLRHTGMFGGTRRAHSPPPSAYKDPEHQEPRRNSTGTRSGSSVRRSSSSKTRSKDAKSASSSRRPSNAERAPPSFAQTRSAPNDIKIPPENLTRGRSDDRYDAPPRFTRSSTMPLQSENERSSSGSRPVRMDSMPIPERMRFDPRGEPRAAPRTSRRTDAQPTVSSGLRHHAETHDSGYSTNSPNEAVPPAFASGAAYAHRSGSDEFIPTTIREPVTSKSRRAESPAKDRYPGSLRRDDSYSSTKYIPADRERGPPPSRSAYVVDAASIRRPVLSRSNSHSSKAIPTLRTSTGSPRASPREPDAPRFRSPFKDDLLFGEVYRSRSPDEMSPTSPNGSRERLFRERSYRDGPPSAARRGVPLADVAYVRQYDQSDIAYAAGGSSTAGAGLGRRNSISAGYNTVEPRPSGRRTSASGRGSAKVFMPLRRGETSVY